MKKVLIVLLLGLMVSVQGLSAHSAEAWDNHMEGWCDANWNTYGFVGQAMCKNYLGTYSTIGISAEAVNDAFNNAWDDHAHAFVMQYADTLTIDNTWVENLFEGMGAIFGLQIFPGITVGTLAIIPIGFAVFRWFMKIIGGGS